MQSAHQLCVKCVNCIKHDVSVCYARLRIGIAIVEIVHLKVTNIILEVKVARCVDITKKHEFYIFHNVEAKATGSVACIRCKFAGVNTPSLFRG